MVLAVSATLTCLIPGMFSAYSYSGGASFDRLAMIAADPKFIAIGAVAGMIVLGVIWWKGAASAPELILVPAGALLVCQSAGVFRHEMQHSSEHAEPPGLSISAYEGVEVRCNGILLGTAPLKLTLEEFDERVKPVSTPPAQEHAFRYSKYDRKDSLKWVEWGSHPLDPHESESTQLGDTTESISKRFAEARYFWTFRIGDFYANSISRSRHNNSVQISVYDWETLTKHVAALKALAKEENVDPLVEWADHIDERPPLRNELTPRVPQEQQSRVMHSFRLDRYSKEALSFEEAVVRRDWLWIARSNDPRSVPLLKLFLERNRRHHRTDEQLLNFSEDLIVVLMDSEQPEIQEIVRRIMSFADWTDTDLLEHYIDRQLQQGADREELTSWLGPLREELSNDFLRLMIRIGGRNFPEHAGPFGTLPWSSFTQDSPEVPDVVFEWLARQWRQSPTGEVARAMTEFSENEILRNALTDINLSNATNVRDFVGIVNNSNSSEWMKETFSEAGARALESASDEAHVRELAQFLAWVPSQRGLKALESWKVAENKWDEKTVARVSRYVEDQAKRIRNALKSAKEKHEAQLKTARDLLAGNLSSADLVHRTPMVWKDGTYVPAATTESGDGEAEM